MAAMEPGVGPPVVTEVVVRRVLAAEHGVRLGHHLLDEGVADAGAHRLAAVLPDDLGDGLGADQVVDDGAAPTAGEHRLGHDRGRRRPTHGFAAVVDQEHAVGVAVERQPDVGAGLEHALAQRLEVLGLDRVGGMVRERAVELAEEHLEVEREPGEDPGHHEPTHAVRGVGHDLQGPERGDVDERADVGGELGEEILLPHLTALLGPLEEPRRDRVLDLGEPGGLADGRGAGPAELDAVVLRRVVAGGEHRGRRVERSRGEVDEVGRREADVDHVGAGERGPLDEGAAQRDGRRPHVVADHDRRARGEPDERVADALGDGFVDLVRVDAANVIGLEDGVERIAHDRALSRLLTALRAGRPW